ncbi:MAG: metal-dependent transcriptional regulator [Clostridiales bacterium]|nr:metal-dependent transcriptional regulator [Clostridiales bacterium]
MSVNKKLRASGEDYLETIFQLRKQKGAIRSVDVVAETGYSKSSVSRAVNLLKEKQYVTIDTKGFIELTELGYGTANGIYERHKILTQYFIAIGVGAEAAETDACQIEHVISSETFNAIKNVFEKK